MKTGDCYFDNEDLEHIWLLSQVDEHRWVCLVKSSNLLESIRGDYEVITTHVDVLNLSACYELERKKHLDVRFKTSRRAVFI